MLERYPSLPYVAPFAVFIGMMALRSQLSLSLETEYPLRVVVTAAVLWVASRGLISWRLARPLESILLGVAVFVVWVGPDVLWPSYRSHWLFNNAVIGTSESAVPADLRTNALFLFFRIVGTALLVPVIEELFWRAWLMRYVIDSNFKNVPLGTYAAGAFWITAVLFASEHGSYWDVGLLAGIAYNWWMIRTRSLADCILAHAVTNACLAVYVLALGQWRYWL